MVEPTALITPRREDRHPGDEDGGTQPRPILVVRQCTRSGAFDEPHRPHTQHSHDDDPQHIDRVRRHPLRRDEWQQRRRPDLDHRVVGVQVQRAAAVEGQMVPVHKSARTHLEDEPVVQPVCRGVIANACQPQGDEQQYDVPRSDAQVGSLGQHGHTDFFGTLNAWL